MEFKTISSLDEINDLEFIDNKGTNENLKIEKVKNDNNRDLSNNLYDLYIDLNFDNNIDSNSKKIIISNNSSQSNNIKYGYNLHKLIESMNKEEISSFQTIKFDFLNNRSNLLSFKILKDILICTILFIFCSILFNYLIIGIEVFNIKFISFENIKNNITLNAIYYIMLFSILIIPVILIYRIIKFIIIMNCLRNIVDDCKKCIKEYDFNMKFKNLISKFGKFLIVNNKNKELFEIASSIYKINDKFDKISLDIFDSFNDKLNIIAVNKYLQFKLSFIDNKIQTDEIGFIKNVFENLISIDLKFMRIILYFIEFLRTFSLKSGVSISYKHYVKMNEFNEFLKNILYALNLEFEIFNEVIDDIKSKRGELKLKNYDNEELYIIDISINNAFNLFQGLKDLMFLKKTSMLINKKIQNQNSVNQNTGKSNDIDKNITVNSDNIISINNKILEVKRLLLDLSFNMKHKLFNLNSNIVDSNNNDPIHNECKANEIKKVDLTLNYKDLTSKPLIENEILCDSNNSKYTMQEDKLKEKLNQIREENTINMHEIANEVHSKNNLHDLINEINVKLQSISKNKSNDDMIIEYNTNCISTRTDIHNLYKKNDGENSNSFNLANLLTELKSSNVENNIETINLSDNEEENE